jgi:glycosyltransferase involved in cell wall biosynthesis
MRMVQALGWYFPQATGGTEVYVDALCRRLRAAGHEPQIVAPDPTTDREYRYQHEGIPVFRYPIPPRPTRDEVQDLTTARGAERFHAFLDRLRPDVVHLHTLGTGLGVGELQAARASGGKLFVTAHESRLGHLCQRGTLMRWGSEPCDGLSRPAKCAACALEHRGLPRPLARLVGAIPPTLGAAALLLPGRLGTALSMSDLIARNLRLQRELVALVDRFVLLTRAALEIVAANGAPREKLVLNRLGISHVHARKPEAPTRAPVTVGYLGRFDEVKGLRVLAAAIARLPRALPLRVELRGPVRYPAERALAAEVRGIFGPDARVHFAPPVAPAEAPSVLAGYDVLCCPSLCLEGGPTVALEAQAVGTPVIGSRIGGLCDLGPDGSGYEGERLVPPGDVHALSELLRRVAEDPAGTVDRWRRAMPPPRTMDEVAADHLAMYGA